MIHLSNVKKRFKDIEAVEDVTLQVKKGSIYGLLGSNGAGKTTLLRMIAGILKQDTGEISINGNHVYENLEMKNRLFFIPDYPHFFSQYTIKQMAKFYQHTYENWNQERFTRLGDVFKIDVNKKIQSFSKGMQRQVAFWLAMSTMPDVLILDEPIDGLDPVMRKIVKNLIIQDVAEREMTVLISSHNLREIEDLCDHIGILHRGSLLLEKEIDDLKSDHHKIQVSFRNELPSNWLDGLDVVYKEKRGSVFLFIIRGKEEAVSAHIKEFQPIIFDLLPLTLEEIFIYEMGGAGYDVNNILV
ncbi:ABC transporter ATP-binding protein [Metabacillus idriensis]|uniref:ABC transporter ATP-binding protein n=1 Tax=Metabacillus idriensis TaxID=324768 RepID=UPI00163AAD6E|nr:ABC transporter ATP-binding protein [Metabacillus idriensis]QNG59325.1 ABC transporter ATP-binding protein [Bacillus sp. PAMC26568]